MFANPESNIAQLGLREGMKVADLGAGAGEYSKSASARVGKNGTVYAVEVQKEMVARLQNELKEWMVTNVECIWGDIETKGGTKLADKTMDAVILSNVFFQTEDKLGGIDEAKRILKPKGKLLVIDWSESFAGMGPSKLSVVSKEQCINMFENRGFHAVESISAGAHHYGIIFMYEK